MKKFDADTFYENLEKTGEKQVRTNLAANIYDSRKARLAQEWLTRKDQERAATFEREQMEIARDAAASARRAADSARDTAREARTANRIAIAAIIIAIASIIVSVLRPYLP